MHLDCDRLRSKVTVAYHATKFELLLETSLICMAMYLRDTVG